uniref:HEAT repeat-containing protein 6 n=2 Tax=Cacopsylla melanoneura TaxID=428564 RepID=A0A8D8LYR9_9HEMI
MFQQEIDRLNSYAQRLNQLFYSPSKADKAGLNSLLDDLNSLHYKYYFLQNQKPDKVILIINQLCTLITTQDNFLVAKHCQLIHQIISTQHIVLTDATLKLTLQWCLQALSSCPSISTGDVLLALNTLIASHMTSQVVNSVSSVLFDTLVEPLENKTTVNLNDVFLFRMKCLNGLIPHLSSDKLDVLGSQTLTHLCSLHPCSHFLLITLRTICQYHSDQWITSHLGSLISTVLAYAKYDLPGYVFVKPKPIFPSPGFQLDLSVDTSSNSSANKAVSSFKTRAKNKKKNKDRDEEVDIIIVSPSPCNTQSDSEYSDSEISRLKKVNASIRLTCFKLLSTILDKVNKKQVFGFLSTLMLGTESLPSCLLLESSAKCRVAILSALVQIFTHSKPFLALAQFETKSDRSFIPFTSLLADVIVFVHDKLLALLQQEQYASVLIQLLKCIDTLAINCPYDKLRSNLRQQLTDAVFPYLSHRDANITVVALTCFSDMIGLCSNDVLVRLCHLVFSKLQNDDTLVPVLVECWQLLSVVAKLKVNLVLEERGLWTELTLAIDRHLRSNCDTRVQSNDTKQHSSTLCCNTNPKQHSNQSNSNPKQEPKQYSTSSSVKPEPKQHSSLVQLHAVIAVQNFCQQLHLCDKGEVPCTELWVQIMTKKYFISLQERGGECPALLTAICDCLASMNPNTYNTLDRTYQRTCLVILFGHCSHEEASVRASAVRGLAIYTLYEYEDPVLLGDVADILVRGARDSAPLVRGKAAWSLGNLSDTLVSHPECGADINLLHLLQACLHCCEDSEKIRSNAVRPLGIFLKLITADHTTGEEYRVVLEKSVELLIRLATNGTNMKIKWNTCYALGHILCNPHITRLPQGPVWKASIFSCLCNLLTTCNNFKVKISICTTLSSLAERKHYEPHFLTIVSTVLSSFAVVRAHTYSYDVHITSLIVTLKRTLCHFILRLNGEDLTDEKLANSLAEHVDEVSTVWKNECEEVSHQLDEEKCSEKIGELSEGGNGRCKVLLLLRRIFDKEEVVGC